VNPDSMRIAIATDAWLPQVNGVVRTLCATTVELDRRGHEVELLTPQRFLTVPLPGYSEIRLAVAPRFGLRRMMTAFAPEVVHIATEGPIGWAARRWCLDHGVPFTTAFHTRFPEYAAIRTGIDADRFWPVMRRFHAQSSAVLVATASLRDELERRGFAGTRLWSRGIDRWTFRPEGEAHPLFATLPRPILLNVGRVAPEKNLEAFLSADVPGTKVVVGDGPALDDLRTRFPQAVFTGAMAGEELASAYRGADCFVFPSLTDTFGLVVIEALACGTPVAAYPVPGPLDILGGPEAEGAGALDTDLPRAIGHALTCDRKTAARWGARYSWESATDLFVDAIRSAIADKGARMLEPA